MKKLLRYLGLLLGIIMGSLMKYGWIVRIWENGRWLTMICMVVLLCFAAIGLWALMRMSDERKTN